MTRCQRCKKEADVFACSYFNTETICIECNDAERRHPEYKHAKRVENEAVRRGDYNYPGVGLPADLRK